MKTEIIKITPRIAQEMLKNNSNNRPLSEKYLQRLVLLMKNGEWKEGTGEAIKFGMSGKMHDGQHRLTALIMAGITLEFLVISGLNDDIFEVIDQGRMRNQGDVLSCAGVKNYKSIAAGINYYLILKSGNSTISRGLTNRTSPKTVLDVYLNNPSSFQESFIRSSKWCHKFKGITEKQYYAIYHLLKVNNPVKSLEFFEKLSSGENLVEGDPILTLRNILIRSMGVKDRTTPSVKLAYIIRAWNAYIEGKQLKVIQYSPENHEYPKFKNI